MSERIAEFADLDDANRFRRLKGPEYDVVGGIHLPWAVMPKIQYASNFSGDEPPELRTREDFDDE